MSNMVRELFRNFLQGLPNHAGYCVDCLTKLWGERPSTIRGYLDANPPIVAQHADCGNCGERKETFRGSRQ